ncbi:MAG: lanthionine synthetase LanC family protein [Pseudonocardia sp.]
MAEHLEGLRAAVAAVRITSASSFTWFGAPAYRLASRWTSTLSAQAVAIRLAAALADQLYCGYYTRGAAAPADPAELGWLPDPHRAVTDPGSSRRVWRPGWTVREVVGDEVAVTSGDLVLWVPRSSCAPGRGEPRPGGDVSVLLPRTSGTISPGFRLVEGARPPTTAGSGTVVRVYWNVHPRATGAFLDRVTSALDAAGVGHVVKALDGPVGRHRCDTGVLYLAASEFADAAPTLRALVDRMAADLRVGTPALTSPLARGVAVAESPRGDGSFGRNRCRAVADAILATHADAPGATDQQRFTAVLARLAASGVRPEEPHLNPGSAAKYILPPGFTTVQRRTAPSARPLPLDVDVDIANRLCADAIWAGRRCSWLGFDDAEPGSSTLRAIGADLFDGTAGIALFLAHVAVETAVGNAGRTAIGAARQALALAADEPGGSTAPIGLYSGAAGVAFAVAQVGALLGRPDLLSGAARLIRRTRRADERSEATDLIAGHAGRIVALLCLAPLLDDPGPARDSAVRSGARLLDLAVRRDRGGWSWRTPHEMRRHLHLTGLSHGAAGIGHALAELYAATGDATYRHAALSSFEYERTWFRAEEGNWPDLRRTDRRSVAEQPVFGHAWCHGAPGIALSRLRAHDTLGEPVLLREARIALATTGRAVRRAITAGPADYSLCHGVLGQLDVLLQGRHHAPGGTAATRQLVQDAVASMSAYASEQRPWPCGSPSGDETPGLMLGLAGIGLQYLRMRRRDVIGSPLLPVPAQLRYGQAAGGP